MVIRNLLKSFVSVVFDLYLKVMMEIMAVVAVADAAVFDYLRIIQKMFYLLLLNIHHTVVVLLVMID